MTNELRVIIYTPCYNILDGVVFTIRKLEREILAANGHVMIITTKSGDRANTHMDGIGDENREVVFMSNSFPIPFLKDENNPKIQYHFSYSLSSSTKKKIQEFAPTVIHITVPDFSALCLISFAREHQIPLMGTYHSNIADYMDHYPGLGFFKPWLIAYFVFCYGFLQALYVPTPFIRKHLCESMNLDQYTDIKIWGRGIDLEKFAPEFRSEAFREDLGIKSNEVVILFVGRLVPEKRLDIFANVVRRLHKTGVPFKAIIVGVGPLQDQMKELPNTILTGWLSGVDLSVVYASSDIFLFPSGVETFGNVTLEAAASGLPLIVEKRCSGHLVHHGENGWACDDGDMDNFFESTHSLVVDIEKRKRFAENSRQNILAFELHTIGKQMIANYRHSTDQFYELYDGDHGSRDLEWRDTGLIGGTIARPFAFIVVEFILMFLFRGAFLLVEFFMWSMRCIRSTSRKKQNLKKDEDINTVNENNSEDILSMLESNRDSNETNETNESSRQSCLALIGDGRTLRWLSEICIKWILFCVRTASVIEMIVCNLFRKITCG